MQKENILTIFVHAINISGVQNSTESHSTKNSETFFSKYIQKNKQVCTDLICVQLN